MSQKVQVIFLAKCAPYNNKDRAGFDAARARELVESGVARFADPQEDALSCEERLAKANSVVLLAERKLQAVNDELGAAQAQRDKAQAELDAANSRLSSVSGDGDGDEYVEDYNDLTVAQLKEELDAREVEYPKAANKARLVALLEADDEAEEDSEGETESQGDGEGS